MGIGFALASGLVQGFTQNIGREMERRASEKEKLEAYRMAITNAALTGGEDFNKANAKVIGEMVSAAEGRLDKQAGIDLFGTAGDSIFEGDKDAFEDLIAKLQGGDPAKAGMTTAKIGNLEFLVPEEYADQRGQPRGDIILYEGLNQFALENKAAFEKHFIDNPEDREIFKKKIPQLAGTYLTARTTSTDGNVMRHMSLDKLDGYGYFDKFFHIGSAAKFDADKTAMVTAADSPFNVDLRNNPSMVPISARLIDGKSEEGAMAPFIMSELTTSDNRQVYNDDMQNAIDRLAVVNGMSSGHFLYNYSKQFDSLTDFADGMEVVTELYLRGAAGDKKGDVTAEQLASIGEYLVTNEQFKDDPLLQAKALVNFRPMITSQAERDMVDAGIKDPDFFSSKSFEEQFEKSYGIKVIKFEEKTAALDSANDKLKRLYEVASQTTFVSDSFFETVAKQVMATFGDTGRVDQVLAILGVDGLSDEARAMKNHLTAGKGGDLVTIAEKDVLRYIIAADLAKAEDDAGRLSDADIQRNLAKLSGFGATDKAGELRAIQTVIDDVAKRSRDLEVTRGIVDKRRITREDRRLLVADRLARRARRAHYNVINPASKTDAAPVNTPVSIDQFNDSEIFLNSYIDQSQNITVPLQRGDQTLSIIAVRGRLVDPDDAMKGYQYYGLLSDAKTIVPLTEAEAGTALTTAQQIQSGAADNDLASSAAAPQSAAIIPNTNKEMVVTNEVTRKGSLGDGGTFPYDPSADFGMGFSPAAPASQAVAGRLTQGDLLKGKLEERPNGDGTFTITDGEGNVLGKYTRKQAEIGGKMRIVYDPVQQ
tara:strand:- start:2517 stop:4979 length:2463 start_codon:yes stop_codon:yes gene_type:complete